MPNPPPGPEARDDSSLPAPIRAALDRIPYLPIKAAHRDALYRVVRCASATDPSRRFRLSVEYLMRELQCSRSTAKRRLQALRAGGWIGRWQSTRGARRHGWRSAWTWLTEQALQALGLALQRGSQPARTPNPALQGNRFQRLRRLPPDLQPLAARIGERRVVWLMSECRRAGRRLQELAAAALQADNPAGFVLRALRGAAQHSSTAPAGRPHDTADETRAAVLDQQRQHRAALSLQRLQQQAAALRQRYGGATG